MSIKGSKKGSVFTARQSRASLVSLSMKIYFFYLIEKKKVNLFFPPLLKKTTKTNKKQKQKHTKKPNQKIQN